MVSQVLGEACDEKLHPIRNCIRGGDSNTPCAPSWRSLGPSILPGGSINPGGPCIGCGNPQPPIIIHPGPAPIVPPIIVGPIVGPLSRGPFGSGERPDDWSVEGCNDKGSPHASGVGMSTTSTLSMALRDSDEQPTGQLWSYHRRNKAGFAEMGGLSPLVLQASPGMSSS